MVHTSSTSEVILVVNPVPEEPADPSPVPGVVDNGGTFDAYHLMEPPLVYLVTLIIAVIIVLVSYALLVIGRGGLLPRD